MVFLISSRSNDCKILWSNLLAKKKENRCLLFCPRYWTWKKQEKNRSLFPWHFIICLTKERCASPSIYLRRRSSRDAYTQATWFHYLQIFIAPFKFFTPVLVCNTIFKQNIKLKKKNLLTALGLSFIATYLPLQKPTICRQSIENTSPFPTWAG